MLAGSLHLDGVGRAMRRAGEITLRGIRTLSEVNLLGMGPGKWTVGCAAQNEFPQAFDRRKCDDGARTADPRGEILCTSAEFELMC